MKIGIERRCLETYELATVFHIEINNRKTLETQRIERESCCWLGSVSQRQQPSQAHSQRISPVYPRLAKGILLTKSQRVSDYTLQLTTGIRIVYDTAEA